MYRSPWCTVSSAMRASSSWRPWWASSAWSPSRSSPIGSTQRPTDQSSRRNSVFKTRNQKFSSSIFIVQLTNYMMLTLALQKQARNKLFTATGCSRKIVLFPEKKWYFKVLSPGPPLGLLLLVARKWPAGNDRQYKWIMTTYQNLQSNGAKRESYKKQK